MNPCKNKNDKSKQVDKSVKNNKIDKECFWHVQVFSEFAYECESKKEALENERHKACWAETENISFKLSDWTHFPSGTYAVHKRLDFGNESDNIENHYDHYDSGAKPDMIFVKKFTRPQFWQQEFYAKNA